MDAPVAVDRQESTDGVTVIHVEGHIDMSFQRDMSSRHDNASFPYVWMKLDQAVGPFPDGLIGPGASRARWLACSVSSNAGRRRPAIR
jgi:hypothetical protein